MKSFIFSLFWCSLILGATLTCRTSGYEKDKAPLNPALPGLDQAGELAAEKIKGLLPLDKEAGYMLIPFFQQGRVSALGQELAWRVQASLQKIAPYLKASVTKKGVERLLDLVKGQMSDLFGQGTPLLGKLAGHRYQIWGEIKQSLQGAMELQGRVVDFETGTKRFFSVKFRAKQGDFAPIEKTGKGAASLRASFGYEIQDPSGLNIGLTDMRSLKVDENTRLRFFFSLREKALVYLFAVGTSGKGLLVFPNRQGLLEKGKEIKVPPEEGPAFTFRGDRGRERFFFIVFKPSMKNCDLAKSLNALLRIKPDRDGLRWINKQKTARLVKKINKARREVDIYVRTEKLLAKLAMGENPGDIIVRDLAIIRPDNHHQKNRFQAELKGTDILIEEFDLDHR